MCSLAAACICISIRVEPKCRSCAGEEVELVTTASVIRICSPPESTNPLLHVLAPSPVVFFFNRKGLNIQVQDERFLKSHLFVTQGLFKTTDRFLNKWVAVNASASCDQFQVQWSELLHTELFFNLSYCLNAAAAVHVVNKLLSTCYRRSDR